MERTASTSSERESGQRKRRESDRTAGRSDGGRGATAALHRAAGNQAVKELHERGALQPKLSVSRPNDAAEREAERVAEAVVDSDAGSDEAGRVPAVQRRATGGRGGPVADETEKTIRSLSGGSPLPESTQSFFESRFGRDFSDVRVHTGLAADRAARSIDAAAFTIGTDVAFASGNYRPHAREGRELLAHELTHVVQQGGDGGPVQRQETDTPEGYRGNFQMDNSPTIFNTTEGVSFGYQKRGDQWVWVPPYSDDTVTTYGQAANTLADFHNRLGKVPDTDKPFLLQDTEDMTGELRDEFVKKQGSLSRTDARRLGRVGTYIYDAYHQTVGGKPTQIAETLDVSAKTDVLDSLYQEIAEKLHFAFVQGNQGASKLSEYVDAIKGLNSDIGSILENARDVQSALEFGGYEVDLPEFVSKIEDFNSQVQSIVDGVSNMISHVELIFDWTSEAPSKMFTMLDKIQAGVDTIDTIMGFVNVPVINESFGRIWSEYCKKAVDKCLDGLRTITRGYDLRSRQLTYLVSSWGDPESPEMEPPQIPDKKAKYFPGGQPVLDFMWVVVHGGYESPSDEAKTFFENHEDHIRALVPGSQSKLSTIPLVMEYPDLVWVMLYGNMPQEKGAV